MSEPDIRVALKGDLILCPSCEQPLAEFRSGKGPRFRLRYQPLAKCLSRMLNGEKRAHLRCRDCDVSAVDPGNGKRTHVDGYRPIELQQAPRLLIQSGTWKGWRAMGGE